MSTVSRGLRRLVSLGLIGWAGSLGAGELPRDAKALVDAHEREVAGARQKLSKETQEWHAGVIKRLKAVQRKLAVDDQLDEAILVRAVVRKLEAERGTDATTALPADELLKLPKEAQAILIEREPPGDVDRQLQAVLADKRKSLRATLTELQTAYSKDDKLDEAVAIRDWMRANLGDAGPAVPAAAIPEAPDRDITAGAGDFAAVENNFQQATRVEFFKLNRILADASDRLLPRLKTAQTAHAKAGRVDAAVAIRNLIQTLTAEAAGYMRARHVRELRPSLPADAAAAADQFLKEADAAQGASEAVQQKLTAQWLACLEAEVGKALAAGDLEKSRGLLTKLYMAKGRSFPYHWAGHYGQPLKIAEPARQVLAQFSADTEQRLQAADERQAPLRKGLLEALHRAQDENLKADEEYAVARLIAYLEDAAQAGLRGLVLLPAEPDLCDDRAAAVKQFRREVRRLLETAQADHRQAFAQLLPRLDEARQSQIAAGDWEAAFSTLDSRQHAPPPFAPIPVKLYMHGPGHGWDASVIDFRDGVFLVETGHGREQWFTRDAIRVDHERPPTEEQPLGTEAPPPGTEVTSQTLLQAGGMVLIKDGFRWTAVETLEVLPEGVRIHFPGYTASWDKVVERAQLRSAAEEP